MNIRPASSVEERAAKGRITGQALGSAEPNGQIDPEEGVGVVGLSEEGDGLGVVAQGIGRREGEECHIGRSSGVVDGLGQIDGWGGGDPMPRQLADPGARVFAAKILQRSGNHLVSQRSARCAQVRIQRAG
jgi:hypothetical protein